MQRTIEFFFEACVTELGWTYDPTGRHSDIVRLQDVYMQNGCVWCLFLDAQLIGMVAVRTLDTLFGTAEMKRLYVLSAHQGKGYGRMLFKHALQYCIERKYNKVVLNTRNDRIAALHLIRKFGFMSRDKYDDNPFAQQYFELSL